MEKNSFVRTIYLYVFALLGLILVIIGSVSFVDMGLKAYVFTKAEEEQRAYKFQPPMPYQIERVESMQIDGSLSKDEQELVKQWLSDYKDWKENYSKIDLVVSNRHGEASRNLSFILVGLPLYLYHWRIIKKEIKKQIN